MNRIQVFSLIFALLFFQFVSANQNRVALVIGNGSYQDAPLKNPVNDANLVAKNLKKLGFKVILKTDANQQLMDEAITDFGQQLQQGDVGLFFYAGHGIQSRGNNYLIPVGSQLKSEGQLKYQSINAGRVLEEMRIAGNSLNIVILDACRNNPLTRDFRNSTRGLARIDDVPRGTLLAYSTSPGDVAADGKGLNSPYTMALVEAMQTKGQPLELVFKEVTKGVQKNTRGEQLPWMTSSVTGDFYFSNKGKNIPLSATINNSQVETDISDKVELEFWSEVKLDPSYEMYEAYLENYPNGFYSAIARIKLKKIIRSTDATDSVEYRTGHVIIRSNVNGDKVTLNGEVKGSTRLNLDLKPGSYALKVSKNGYKTWVENLEVKPDSNQTIFAKLKVRTKKKAPKGCFYTWNDDQTDRLVCPKLEKSSAKCGAGKCGTVR